MSDSPPAGRERRVYTRHDVAFTVGFEVHGADGSSKRVLGATINISRGGVLLDVGIAVDSNLSCLVDLTAAGPAVTPTHASGKVVHSGVWKHGRQAVAVQFDTPLEKLELPDIG